MNAVATDAAALAELTLRREDGRRAADELQVAVPVPGTDLARVVKACRALQTDRERLRMEVGDLTKSLVRVRQRADVADARVAELARELREAHDRLQFLSAQWRASSPMTHAQIEALAAPFATISEEELGVRALHAVTGALACDEPLVAHVAALTPSRLLKTKNFGRKSLREIDLMLEERGLRLGLPINPECYRRNSFGGTSRG